MRYAAYRDRGRAGERGRLAEWWKDCVSLYRGVETSEVAGLVLSIILGNLRQPVTGNRQQRTPKVENSTIGNSTQLCLSLLPVGPVECIHSNMLCFKFEFEIHTIVGCKKSNHAIALGLGRWITHIF